MGLLQVEPYYNWLALHIFHSMFVGFEIKKSRNESVKPKKKYVKWWIFQFVPSLKGLCLANIKFVIMYVHYVVLGKAVAQWLRCHATNRKVAGSIPAGVIGFFIDIKYFWSHCGPGVDSASNRNEYQEHLLGVKAASA